jgi:hypothetical protein
MEAESAEVVSIILLTASNSLLGFGRDNLRDDPVEPAAKSKSCIVFYKTTFYGN